MRLQRLITFSSIALLGACGGGSDGDGNNVVDPGAIVGALQIPITEETAPATTAIVLESMDEAFDASESALGFGGAVGAVVETDGPGAVATALAMADRARDSIRATSGALPTGAVITETEACTGGGEATVTIDTGSLSEQEFVLALQDGVIPSGVSITTAFDNCLEEEAGLLDGSVTLVIEQLDIDGVLGVDTFTMVFSAIFDDFVSEEGSLDGDISLSAVSGPGQTNVDVSGDSLAVGLAGESLTLLDYVVDTFEDNTALVENFDFTLRVSGLGQITVDTLEAWRTLGFSETPISGVLRIVGLDNGSILVTALDEMSVQLDVDEDGDGTVDATIITTWDELED